MHLETLILIELPLESPNLLYHMRTPIMLQSRIPFKLKGDPRMWARHSFSTSHDQTPIVEEDLSDTPLKIVSIVDVNFQLVVATRQPINRCRQHSYEITMKKKHIIEVILHLHKGTP